MVEGGRVGREGGVAGEGGRKVESPPLLLSLSY